MWLTLGSRAESPVYTSGEGSSYQNWERALWNSLLRGAVHSGEAYRPNKTREKNTQLCSPPSLRLLLVTRLSEPNQKQEGWGAHGYSQHLGSLSKVGTWIEGTFQQMGNNQYRHLLVKNILIASDKAYPNLTETKTGIYWKS